MSVPVFWTTSMTVCGPNCGSSNSSGTSSTSPILSSARWSFSRFTSFGTRTWAFSGLSWILCSSRSRSPTRSSGSRRRAIPRVWGPAPVCSMFSSRKNRTWCREGGAGPAAVCREQVTRAVVKGGNKERARNANRTDVHGDALCYVVKTWARQKTTEALLNNGWRLAAVGGWRLAVGGPWGLSLPEKNGVLKYSPAGPCRPGEDVHALPQPLLHLLPHPHCPSPPSDIPPPPHSPCHALEGAVFARCGRGQVVGGLCRF